MKNIRFALSLALCLTLALAAVPALADATFAYADLTVNGVAPGATPAEAEALLGTPAEKDEPVTEAATGATLQTWRYDGLELVFSDGELTQATLQSPAYTGPRGLKIGDPETALAAAFSYDAAQAKDGVLYSAGWVESLETPLPPCATVAVMEDGTSRYLYVAPVTPYTAEVLASPESFLFETAAMLTVTVDAATRNIAAITWDVRAMAE